MRDLTEPPRVQEGSVDDETVADGADLAALLDTFERAEPVEP